MNLLEEFLRQLGLYAFGDAPEDVPNKGVEDPDFDYADGEEGVNGIIRYYDPSGNLIAIQTIHGGDSEDTEFTEHGKAILTPLAQEVFNTNLTRIEMVKKTELK